jgi:hypothetical protein
MRTLTVAAVVAALSIVTAAEQLRTPLGRMPAPRDLPGIGRLLNDPPLTTTGEDAWLEAPSLDGWSPATFAPLVSQPRNADGEYVLRPGGYGFDAESYCLLIASRGPVTGDGFLNAPLKGPLADVVRSILKNAAAHPGIPQRDVQVLLWSLLARVKVNDLNPRLQGIAAQLLTAQELESVSNNFWDLLETPAGRRAVRELPQPVQRALSAERRVRDLVRAQNYNYEQIERIAMTPAAVLPKEQPRHVPRGRWMHHPNGFFIRFASRGYPSTRVEVYVPDTYTYRRDALGRILSIEDAAGNGIETDYVDSIEPLRTPADPRLVGYAFKSIRWVRTTADGVQRHEIRDRGWTFVRARKAPPRRAYQMVPAVFRGPAPWQPGRFEGLKERYEQAREARERAEYYRDRVDRMRREPGDEAIDDLENNEHYEEGVDAALGGDTGERLDWITQQRERERDALRRAIVVIDSLPTDSSAEPSYGPWDGAAVPTRSGSQRLGISGRGR